MRFIFVILSVVLTLSGIAQEAIGPVEYINTGLLKKQKLQRSDGKYQPFLTSSEQLHLLVFLSPECPLSINYTKALNELSARYRNKVNIIGVIPGRSYSLAVIDSLSKDYGLKFKLYIDTDKNVTRLAKASVTPEVILFDKNGKTIYRGAIDDWAFAPGKKRVKASNAYLGNAMEAHFAGTQIALPRTTPVGCMINDY